MLVNLVNNVPEMQKSVVFLKEMLCKTLEIRRAPAGLSCHVSLLHLFQIPKVHQNQT